MAQANGEPDQASSRDSYATVMFDGHAPVFVPEPTTSFAEGAAAARQALDEVVASLHAVKGLPPTSSWRRLAVVFESLLTTVSIGLLLASGTIVLGVLTRSG